MLFTCQIENWRDWGKVFLSTAAFTPLAQKIFRQEGLEFTGRENLTPGTNAVFRGGESARIFFWTLPAGRAIRALPISLRSGRFCSADCEQAPLRAGQ